MKTKKLYFYALHHRALPSPYGDTGTALALLKSGRTAMVSAPSPALPGLLVPPVSKTVR